MPISLLDERDKQELQEQIAAIANGGSDIQTLFFTEWDFHPDTPTDVTELVTYKPSFEEAQDNFGGGSSADSVPHIRAVWKQGVASSSTEEILPLITCVDSWADAGSFTLYFANKDYALSLVYQYDTSVSPYGDLLSVTALLTTEVAGGSIDLTDYVKNTDFANRDKHGVVALGYGWGIGCNSKGYLYTEMASNALIDERVNEYNVICPANLDYAVKSIGNGYYATEAEVEEALDAILAIQATLIGGVE